MRNVRARDRGERPYFEDAEGRADRDHHHGEDHAADEVPAEDEPPEPPEFDRRSPSIEHREHGEGGVFGRQFGSAEHDENEAYGVHVRREDLGERLAVHAADEREHRGDQQRTEPEVEAGRQRREEQPFSRTLELGHRRLNLLAEDVLVRLGGFGRIARLGAHNGVPANGFDFIFSLQAKGAKRLSYPQTTAGRREPIRIG